MYQKKFQVLNLEKMHRLLQKKISEKYKKIRDAKNYKIPGEIVKIEEIETPEGKIKVPVSIEKSKKAAKKKKEKTDKIRREKKFKKIVDTMEKKRNTEKIDIVDELKDASLKKNAKIAAKKIVKKYKLMKRPKKIYLVDEKNLETIDYDDTQEDLFKGESIINAVHKVFDLKNFKNIKLKQYIIQKKVRSKQLKRFLKNIKT